MKVYRKRDLKKSGIYCIKNLLNNKVYIGKSTDIYQRILQHINLLNRKSSDENNHLIRSWHKYGRDKFQYFVLEYLEKDEKLLSERELFWITEYDSLNRDKGYNLRLDTNTICILPEETKLKMSESHKKRYEDPLKREKTGIVSREFWKNNPEIKEIMKQKVSDNHTKYKVYQYDKKTKKLVKIWNKVVDIINKNPSYKKHNIYAVCSGEKPTMYGYIWEKVLNNDIVRSE